jgi:hypothetical protein
MVSESKVQFQPARLGRYTKKGSTQETVKMRILRGFLKSEEFGLGERQPLRL